MVQLHPRTRPADRARSKLHEYVLAFSDEHELTDNEMAGILLYLASRFNTFALRAERHPGDPEKKADEA